MLAHDLVKFKGTRHGLLISFIEDASFDEVIDDFKDKIENNASFFKNAMISLDLGWRELSKKEFDALIEFLKDNELKMQGIISSSASTRNIAEEHGIKVIIGRLGLAQHEGRLKKQKEKFMSKAEDVDTNTDSKEQSILIKKTLRSGQKIKYKGNIVIIGDVNPGAEVEAGGDIVVWGNIRGMVHAGFGGREDVCLIAAQIIPTQMRIGHGFPIITYEKKLDPNSIKIAELKGPQIIVSNYKK